MAVPEKRTATGEQTAVARTTLPCRVRRAGVQSLRWSSVGTLILLYFTLSMSRADSSGSGSGGASDAR
nr:unnamed protein product [Digitaria exilis]